MASPGRGGGRSSDTWTSLSILETVPRAETSWDQQTVQGWRHGMTMGRGQFHAGKSLLLEMMTDMQRGSPLPEDLTEKEKTGAFPGDGEQVSVHSP